MASIYCWFDWEDDTTTVNSISVIQEPRKPWNEYEIGERIIAKLPKYGTWAGVIVEISDSKEDLTSHMKERQQYPVYTDFQIAAAGDNIGITGVPVEASSGSKRKSKKAEEKSDNSATCNDDSLSGSTGSRTGSRQQPKKRKRCGNSKNAEKTVDSETDDDDYGSECDSNSSRSKKKLKKNEKAKNEEKTVDKENQKKSKEEKQKKKELEKVRLETKLQEYQDIINRRRKVLKQSPGGLQGSEGNGCIGTNMANTNVNQDNDRANSQDTNGANNDGYNQDNNGANNQYSNADNLEKQDPLTYSSYDDINRLNLNVRQHYSYTQDLGEAGIHFQSSFQSLLTYQELTDQNRDLEAENYNLRQEVKELRERLESRSPSQGSLPDLEVTPRKVEFFKKLTRTLEISQKGSRVSSRQQLFQHSGSTTPVRNITGSYPDIQQNPAILSPQSPAILNQYQSTPAIYSPSLSDTASPNSYQSPAPLRSSTPRANANNNMEDQGEDQEHTYHWEDNVTSAGQKKVQLVSDIACYITQGQLSHALHIGTQPRKLVIALLDILFTREQLAGSSSTGARSAVNASTKTSALPSSAVKAIKTFVLKQFKKDSGEPCLSEALFNTVINSKCATARRSLK